MIRMSGAAHRTLQYERELAGYDEWRAGWVTFPVLQRCLVSDARGVHLGRVRAAISRLSPVRRRQLVGELTALLRWPVGEREEYALPGHTLWRSTALSLREFALTLNRGGNGAS